MVFSFFCPVLFSIPNLRSPLRAPHASPLLLMITNSDWNDRRFQRIDVLEWCTHIEVPFLKDLIRSVFILLCLGLPLSIGLIFHGDHEIGEFVLLGVVIACLWVFYYQWRFKRWERFLLPAKTFVLGWKDNNPVLVKDQAEIRAGKLNELDRRTYLIHAQPWQATPIEASYATETEGKIVVRRLVTVSIQNLDALAVEHWIGLSSQVLVRLVWQGLREYINSGGKVDENDPLAVDSLSRRLESFVNSSREWVPGAIISLCPPKPTEESASRRYPVGVP